MLSEKFKSIGYSVLQAPRDADVMIANTAVAKARAMNTVLIGDDTDLLVLLLYHGELDTQQLFFSPEPRQRDKSRKIWDIKKTKAALSRDICLRILFVHAFPGCDTTSRVHGSSLKKVKTNAAFSKLADIFG